MSTTYPFWSKVELAWPWTNILRYLGSIQTVELTIFLLDDVFWSVWEHWFEVICSWSRTKRSLFCRYRSWQGIYSIVLIALSNDTPQFWSFSWVHNLSANVWNGIGSCWLLAWCLNGVIVLSFSNLHASYSALETSFKRLIRFISTISFLFYITYPRSHRSLSEPRIDFSISTCKRHINGVLPFLLNDLDWIIVGPVLFGESSFVFEL